MSWFEATHGQHRLTDIQSVLTAAQLPWEQAATEDAANRPSLVFTSPAGHRIVVEEYLSQVYRRDDGTDYYLSLAIYPEGQRPDLATEFSYELDDEDLT